MMLNDLLVYGTSGGDDETAAPNSFPSDRLNQRSPKQCLSGNA